MSDSSSVASEGGQPAAPETPAAEFPEFFDFTAVMDLIAEDKDVPARDVKRLMAALTSTRFVPVLANLVEHFSARYMDEHPEAKLHEVKSRLVRTKRLAAAREVFAEVQGYEEEDLMSWKFHAHQKSRRRQLLKDALAAENLPSSSSSRLLKRYVAGVIQLPLREVVRRYRRAREKAENPASHTIGGN